MRITALLARLESAEEMIVLLGRKADALEAGVTLLYVQEERLFDLPVFSGEKPSPEALRDYLKSKVREAGREDWAVLVYEDDTVDRLLLEAEREHAMLLVSDLKRKRGALLARTKTPVLFMEPGRRHECGRGLIVFDPACSGSSCVSQIRKVLGAGKWSAYMDDQIIPVVGAGLSVDPVADTLIVETGLETELRTVHEEMFRRLCEAEKLEGYYEVGESETVANILTHADAVGAECLAVIAEDHDTLLAGALGELAEKAERDLMICFQNTAV